MTSYLVFFILNAILLFGLIKSKKKPLAAISICVEVILLCLVILRAMNISLTPLVFLILNIAAALWCLLEVLVLYLRKAETAVTVAAVLSVLLIAAIVAFCPAFYIFFIINAILLFCLIKNNKKKLIVINICAEFALLCLIILSAMDLLHSNSVFLILNIAAALWCIFEIFILFFKKAKTTAVVAAVLSVLFIASIVFYYPAFQKRTVDSTDYMAVYSKFTGVSETKVSYHYMYNDFFMIGNASYTENYGVLFCGWRDVFIYEPVSVSK